MFGAPFVVNGYWYYTLCYLLDWSFEVSYIADEASEWSSKKHWSGKQPFQTQ